MNATCIICDGVLEDYSKTSNLNLEVNYCKKCNFYITGNTKKEILDKISSL